MLLTLTTRQPLFRATIRETIQGIALCLAFFFLYGSPGGERIARLLDSGPMRWMGKRSYAAYLWNFELVLAMNALNLAPATQSLPLRILLATSLILATFGIAHLSYVFVYLPFAPLRRRFGSHRDTEADYAKASSAAAAESRPGTP